MLRSLSYMLTVSVALVLVSLACAGDGPTGKLGHGCFPKCPNCHNICTLSVEKGTAKHECYEVECKQICIPRVTFPWQKKACCSSCGGKGCGDGKSGCCGRHTCAKAKTVRVLKKYEYECSKCKYRWTPVGDKDGGNIERRTSNVQRSPARDPRGGNSSALRIEASDSADVWLSV